jgi:hypothetical protein
MLDILSFTLLHPQPGMPFFSPNHIFTQNPQVGADLRHRRMRA